MNKGKLYLIPTTLGDTAPLEVLPISVKKVIEMVDDYIVENEKTARHFIKKISSGKSQPSLKMNVLNKYTQEIELPSFLQACHDGKPVGLLSEAGCPGIADPGADIVKIAHKQGIQVVPLVGPSSILMAMMASGFNGQNFTFNGYLPIDAKDRKSALKQLEKESFSKNASQIFIETPYRNNKMLEEICSTLHQETNVCIAVDITLPSEYIKTQIVKDWKHANIDLHKRPAIFIIHKD